MKHDYLNNTPPETARRRFLAAAAERGFSAGSETEPAAACAGRITAAPVYAAISAPHYNASAMDGVAVRAADTFGASERTPVFLPPAAFTVVDTGDPLPPGADAVVMVEEVRETGTGEIKLLAPVSPWENVRQVGEDLCMGDMIAPAGVRITPALVGAFLAGGVTEIPVKKRPVLGVIPTGDEIVPPTAAPKSGEIIEFNSAVFSAMLREWDAETKIYPIVKDQKKLLEAAVQTAAAECDAVLVIAGSSAGRDDCTAAVCETLGEVLLHGIAIKPGKPAVLGFACGKPLVGLPGYPVSGITVMEEIVKPLLARYYGLLPEPDETVPAVLTRRVTSSLKYEEFVRVTLGEVGGRLYAVPLPRGAGIVTSVTKAGGVLRLPRNSEGFEAGETVAVRPLPAFRRGGKTLVVTGSHDPLIDEIANEVNRRGLGFTVVSSHVGSMGAFSAVGAGQAHLGGVHLLDEKTGGYNESWVQKYFPNGGAVLEKGVIRTQGLMVAPGNPLDIRAVSDLVRCRYVNRQRGAGTRVLLDYLLRREGISPAAINGYGNEKYTHTAVAATVAAGNADAGLGIASAARIYGLDFIPLYREEYDFLVGEAFSDDPMVRAFFEILRSEAFARRLLEMGGYEPREVL